MIKVQIYVTIAWIVLLLGCARAHLSNYQPYSQLPQEKVKALTPKNYDDCILAIDKVLSPLVKQHFKNQNSSIAVIELSDEIGGFFTTNWGMYRYNKRYHWPYKTYYNLPKQPFELTSTFISDGVYHPKAMLRIMFSCYYKYLNGQQYNWQDEINNSKKLWPSGNPADYEASLPDTIARVENKILSDYYFNLLHVNDTVNMLYNRSPKLTKKSPDWYYLTAVINHKVPATKSVHVTLVQIISEFNQNFMVRNRDTLFQGDTLTDYYKGWLSTEKYYFNYHTCREYRAK